MKRKLFTNITLLSLLLCMAMVVLWVRSFSRIDYIVMTQYREGFCLLMSVNGFVRIQPVSEIHPERKSYSFTYRPGGPSPRMLDVPHVFLVLVFAFAPCAWLAQGIWHFRNQRIGSHLCICGYNLTGNTSGVCPECGNVVTTKA